MTPGRGLGSGPLAGAATRDGRNRGRRLAALIVALGLGFLALPTLLDAWFHRLTDSAGRETVGAAAITLHDQLVIADLHADSLLWPRPLLERNRLGQVDLPRLADGHVALQVFSVVTSVPAASGGAISPKRIGPDLIVPMAIAQGWPRRTWFSAFERARFQAARFDQTVIEAGARILKIRRRGDLARLELARDEARLRGLVSPLGAVLSLEGAGMLAGHPERVEQLFQAGFRIMGLVHLADNAVGGSSLGDRDLGLTAEGRQVLAAMRRLQIIPDLAHASPVMVREILAEAPGPVLVSHTGLASFCPGPRNLDDDLAREIAAAGGLIGIGFWPGAVCGESVADIVAAIRHAVGVVGVNHVALGSDFDGSVTTPIDAAGLGRVTEGLLASGFSRDEISRIMGGNVIRFLRFALPV